MVLTVFMVGTDGDSSELHARHVGGDSSKWNVWYAGGVTHYIGMHGMRMRDSLQRHAWHVGG